MPKTIFFDLDGTLTDSGPGIMNCARLMLDHYSYPYDDALLRTFIGPPLRVRLEQLGFIVKNGHMFAVENAETGEIVPTKMLAQNGKERSCI